MNNMNDIHEHYEQFIDHQQDIANAHLCDTEPEYRFFTFEVVETRIEIQKRTKYFRIEADKLEGQTLTEMVGNHLTSDEFYDFVNNYGHFIKDSGEYILEDVQEITGNVWEEA